MRERSLEVRLGKVRVGSLQQEANERVSFRFVDAYRQLPQRPVLGQWFEDDLQRVRIHRSQKLLPWFENLLPEGDLRTLICRQHSLALDDDLGLLAAVGLDLPGAVIVGPDSLPIVFEAEPQVEPDITSEEGHVESALRFALAGVQLKLSMSCHEDRWTLPMNGMGGDWIAKIAWTDKYQGISQNEYATMQWARAAGFEVPECRLTTLSNLQGVPGKLPPSTHVFMISRYDRRDTARIHQEDLAQVLGMASGNKYDLTYEKLGILVLALLGADGLAQWLERLVLVIATANGDAHLKNWSVLYPDQTKPTWTPLYDQLCTTMYPLVDRLALKLGGTYDWAALDRKRFEWLARRLEIEPDMMWRCVLDTLARLQAAWREVETELPFSDPHRSALARHWARVPILRDAGGLP